MSLPRSHVESLERHVRIHEERLTLLREQLKNSPRGSDPNPKGDPNPKPPLPIGNLGHRELFDREIHFHEDLIKLARDPKVLKALNELTENRDFAREAARNPRDAAQKRGINLPASLTLRLDHEGDHVRLQISSYHGLYPFMVTWDSDSGFSPLPEPDLPQNGVQKSA